jgi:hypothetical protein
MAWWLSQYINLNCSRGKWGNGKFAKMYLNKHTEKQHPTILLRVHVADQSELIVEELCRQIMESRQNFLDSLP